MRRLLKIATFVLATLLPFPSIAGNTWGTDMSDLWWTPAESGWGANIAHQGEIIFMTVFVYGTDSSAKWFVAPGMAFQGGSGAYTFTGTLYETSGPYFGTSFNSANVINRVVGTASLTFSGVSDATLTYIVNGVQVVKPIQRQTFRTNNIAGSYIGGTIGLTSGCVVGSGLFDSLTQLNITQSGPAVSISAASNNGVSCMYSGTYSQSGRMGSIAGVVACSSGVQGTFQAVELEASYQGFYARYSADYGGGCTETGRIGGMKRD